MSVVDTITPAASKSTRAVSMSSHSQAAFKVSQISAQQHDSTIHLMITGKGVISINQNDTYMKLYKHLAQATACLSINHASSLTHLFGHRTGAACPRRSPSSSASVRWVQELVCMHEQTLVCAERFKYVHVRACVYVHCLQKQFASMCIGACV